MTVGNTVTLAKNIWGVIQYDTSKGWGPENTYKYIQYKKGKRVTITEIVGYDDEIWVTPVDSNDDNEFIVTQKQIV